MAVMRPSPRVDRERLWNHLVDDPTQEAHDQLMGLLVRQMITGTVSERILETYTLEIVERFPQFARGKPSPAD